MKKDQILNKRKNTHKLEKISHTSPFLITQRNQTMKEKRHQFHVAKNHVKSQKGKNLRMQIQEFKFLWIFAKIKKMDCSWKQQLPSQLTKRMEWNSRERKRKRGIDAIILRFWPTDFTTQQRWSFFLEGSLRICLI